MSTIDLKLKSYDKLIFEITTLNTNNYLLQQKVEQLENIRKEAIEFILDGRYGEDDDLESISLYMPDLLNILNKGGYNGK